MPRLRLRGNTNDGALQRQRTERAVVCENKSWPAICCSKCLGVLVARAGSALTHLGIDLSRVSRSNSAGVALLAQWLCQARRRQRELLFVGIPAQMRAIIRVVDLETLLPTA